MKKVFDTENVAHLFANKKQDEARNPQGNFYFNRDIIYSYGSHFPIAKHVTNKKGKDALLFTTDTYRNTTAKHLNTVRSACSHLNIIYCYDPTSYENHTENLKHFHSSIENKLRGIDKAKKPERYIEPAKDILEQIKKYCAFFNIKVPSKSIKLIESAESGKYKEYLLKEAKRIESDKKKAEKKRIENFNESIVKWRNNTPNVSLNNRLFELDYLRYNGKRIETSQGIEIPLQIAQDAFNFIRNILPQGGCLDGSCDYEILDYKVKSITQDYLEIGCHRIEINEINNLAKELKWVA